MEADTEGARIRDFQNISECCLKSHVQVNSDALFNPLVGTIKPQSNGAIQQCSEWYTGR